MAYLEPVTVALKKGKRACIRTRTLEDAPGMQAFMEAVFRDDRFFLSTEEESKQWLTFDVYRNRTETFNGHDAKLLLVAEADGQLVATSDVDCEEKSRNRHVGKIGISIRTDYCGMGLGTELMKVMIDWATAHPTIEKLALGVWAKNERAIRLYEKMGFAEEGRKIREVKYADGSYDDCVCMYRFTDGSQ